MRYGLEYDFAGGKLDRGAAMAWMRSELHGDEELERPLAENRLLTSPGKACGMMTSNRCASQEVFRTRGVSDGFSVPLRHRCIEVGLFKPYGAIHLA